MIYTVTFNPALDCVMHLSHLTFGEVNRSTAEETYFGGKGVNVSQMLHNLGRESICLGFAAGFIGRAMIDSLNERGLTTDFVEVPRGLTRVNMKLRGTRGDIADDQAETAVNAAGPEVDEADVAAFFAKLERVQAGDIVVLAGNLPPKAPKDLYAQVMDALAPHNARIVVDTTGEALMAALPRRPFLIKPNDEELTAIMGRPLPTFDALVEAARELQAKGARNVLVSRGSKGAFILDETGAVTEVPAHKGELVNSVGAGDSSVAGFLHGLLLAEEAGMTGTQAAAAGLKWANACGAATTFSLDIATKDRVERLLAAAE